MLRQNVLIAACIAGVGILVSGCASELANCQHSKVDAWVARSGGLDGDSSLDRRLQTSFKRLTVARNENSNIECRVLASDSVAAFSWSTGEVFVTRGLMLRMSDDQVCAVIAHELAHLMMDGQLKDPATLAPGDSAHLDVEAAADLIGCRILSRSGLSSRHMIDMLTKLQTCVAPEIQPDVIRRMARLESGLRKE